MPRHALPCIACGRELEQVDQMADGNQPYNGTAFVTHGHYGSTIFDPMDGHFLEINVCDVCLSTKPGRIIQGRDKRPVMEDGAIVGWEDVDWRAVPWNPSRADSEHALKVALDELYGKQDDDKE